MKNIHIHIHIHVAAPAQQTESLEPLTKKSDAQLASLWAAAAPLEPMPSPHPAMAGFSFVSEKQAVAYPHPSPPSPAQDAAKVRDMIDETPLNPNCLGTAFLLRDTPEALLDLLSYLQDERAKRQSAPQSLNPQGAEASSPAASYTQPAQPLQPHLNKERLVRMVLHELKLARNANHPSGKVAPPSESPA